MKVRSVAIQMKIKHARAITLGIVAVTAAAFALAACGSSSKATVSPNAQPSATTSTTSGGASSAQPVVKVAMVGTVGNVLVDDTGLTLYTLTKDGAPVACTGQCATFWPPLILPAGTTTAVGDMGVTGLGTAKVSGRVQVTDKGEPLYRFSKDTGPGSAKGEGLATFGGVWHVVQASGSGEVTPTTTTPAGVAPAPATTPPTTSSSYGGGY
jgi:predicted lipoprotein with Yx(FWY)xxD motif